MFDLRIRYLKINTKGEWYEKSCIRFAFADGVQFYFIR